VLVDLSHCPGYRQPFPKHHPSLSPRFHYRRCGALRGERVDPTCHGVIRGYFHRTNGGCVRVSLYLRPPFPPILPCTFNPTLPNVRAEILCFLLPLTPRPIIHSYGHCLRLRDLHPRRHQPGLRHRLYSTPGHLPPQSSQSQT